MVTKLTELRGSLLRFISFSVYVKRTTGITRLFLEQEISKSTLLAVEINPRTRISNTSVFLGVLSKRMCDKKGLLKLTDANWKGPWGKEPVSTDHSASDACFLSYTTEPSTSWASRITCVNVNVGDAGLSDNEIVLTPKVSNGSPGSAALFLAANMEIVSKTDLFCFKTTLLAQRQPTARENYRQLKKTNPG